MKKVIAFAAAVSLLVAPTLPASAASSKTIKVGSLVTVTYPATVKLKTSGCQKISFTYKIGRLGQEDAVYAGILDDSDNLIGGYTFYQTPQVAELSGLSVFKKTGTASFKICRKAWSEELDDGDFEDYTGATKGEFQFYVQTFKADNIGYIKFN